MENHPIPQDVTGFKFRLIGSITVKQFLYLLGAGAIALVFYLLPIPLLIKIPLMLMSGGVGLSLAFVPIDGRPMDKMLLNFIRTIPSENQYLYHKQGVEMPYFAFTPVVKAPIPSAQRADSELSKKTLLFNQLNKAYFKPDPEEQAQVANISNLFQEGSVPIVTRVANADIPATAPKTSSPISVVNPPINDTVSAKPHPVEQVKKSESVVLKTSPLSSPPNPPPISQPHPTQINGVDMPNIIQGTVFDPRGKAVPHVIVEIIDLNKTPLRTFRTNENGTFRAATPLPSGTYTIHLEDTLKKQDFSDVSVTLDGTITQPVTIKSFDQREKLRQELFGGAV